MDVHGNLLKHFSSPHYRSQNPVQLVEKTLLWCRKNQCHILESENISPLLGKIEQSPPVVFVRGNLKCFQLPGLAVVGSRKASNYGLACAYRFSRELAAQGLCIVSGLARGIDGVSHRGAISTGGSTIAVMGSGFAHLYPKEHQKLAFDILDSGGAWLSEYPPFEPPLPFHFPQRNRLISGLSLGTLVIEAKKKSGSLITALCGLEQGRDVFVVPGPIDSELFQGGHELIQSGAKLVSSVRDILEEIPLLIGPSDVKQNEKTTPFSFGRAFTLSDWLKIYGQNGISELQKAVEQGQVFETAPQRYLSTSDLQSKEPCQMKFS
ncbi:MAG: DNA-protecting protein DprA [Proteobacteria bacterium]|nr:DNA-protecting protein DprA [Pseudomonadota bacterium]